MGSPNQPATRQRNDVARSGNLYDVLDLILDRGLVIDVFVRISLLGLELIQIDARIVVASVDTYLRFAEATNRLDLEHTGRRSTLPGLVGEMTEDTSKGKSQGAIEGAVDAITGKVKHAVGAGGDDGDDDGKERTRSRKKSEPEREPARPRRRRRSDEDQE
ncbi:gas vesicle protein GvpJ [Yinghuangia seranimata]|nr:gas vesicle protein GvpJ [Yinghuangia seranimata]MDI2125416.1 gas vesicle protein GvpJ [Yinghuangia seranimata]